jgi:hypothetical protein
LAKNVNELKIINGNNLVKLNSIYLVVAGRYQTAIRDINALLEQDPHRLDSIREQVKRPSPFNDRTDIFLPRLRAIA